MSNQVYRIESYRFSQTDAVLFDANVWLYIYSPQARRYPHIRNTYENALRRIRAVKATIFIDVLVLSEFINAYSRFIYNELPASTKPASFKQYRQSDDFKPVAKEVAKQSRKILSKCRPTESGFESANLSGILRKYGAGDVDFNDEILADLCRVKDLKLVTHDADFGGKSLTI